MREERKTGKRERRKRIIQSGGKETRTERRQAGGKGAGRKK